MYMREHNIFDVKIHDLNKKELIFLLERWLFSDSFNLITTPNPEFLVEACKNNVFKDILNKSSLSLPDGVGLRFAIAALTDDYLRNRQTGVDLVFLLSKLCASNNKRVLLLGGKTNSGVKVVEKFKKDYLNLDIHYIDPGIISGDCNYVNIDSDLVKQISDLKPCVIFVALGQGKQERFILQIKDMVKSIKIGVGIGGSFESISGVVKRAPVFMRSVGMEWLWRLCLEPSRFMRIITATVHFPLIVVWSTLSNRRFFKAVRKVIPEIFRQIKVI